MPAPKNPPSGWDWQATIVTAAETWQGVGTVLARSKRAALRRVTDALAQTGQFLPGPDDFVWSEPTGRTRIWRGRGSYEAYAYAAVRNDGARLSVVIAPRNPRDHKLVSVVERRTANQ